MPLKRYIEGTSRLIVVLFLALIVIVSAPRLMVAVSDIECREYDEVYYEKSNEYALSRIVLKKLDRDSELPSFLFNERKEFSPQGTKHYVVASPDFMKNGPWNTDIYVLGNRANPLKLKVTFLDHGNGGVRVKWLNEKLLFFQVWWGRIVSTDLILDVDTSKWIYSQNANYGNMVMPCDEKMKNR